MENVENKAKTNDELTNGSDSADCEDCGSNVVIDEAEVIKNLEKSAAENLDRFQRTLAEFDNYRKRTVKEKSAAYDDGASAVLSSLLPVLDNFERALASCSDRDRQTQFFTGIDLIFKQLSDIMQSNNIKVIESVGESFNPNIHSAIAHVDDDSFGEGEIVEDLQKGYMYKDRILRHSVVKVAN